MSDLNLAPQGAGPLEKMRASVQDDGTVSYALPLGEQTVPLNPLLGARLQLRFEQAIFCTACGRKTNKSFNQGYCYPCFQRLAACDSCIVSPEKCHFAAGTCREPDWAERFCMTDHLVYLANSTGLKVGITRVNQVPTRWIDQGASAAVLFARTQTRHLAGLVEVILKAHVADRTQWQRLLKARRSRWICWRRETTFGSAALRNWPPCKGLMAWPPCSVSRAPSGGQPTIPCWPIQPRSKPWPWKSSALSRAPLRASRASICC